MASHPPSNGTVEEDVANHQKRKQSLQSRNPRLTPSTNSHSDDTSSSGFTVAVSDNPDFFLGVGEGRDVRTFPDDGFALEVEQMIAHPGDEIAAEAARLHLIAMEQWINGLNYPPGPVEEDIVALQQTERLFKIFIAVILMLAGPLLGYIWWFWMTRFHNANYDPLSTRNLVILTVVAMIILPHYRMALNAWRRGMI